MIKIECGDCRCDMNTGDLCFCEDCYKKLENSIELLEEENGTLKRQIKNMEEQYENQKKLTQKE